MEEKIKQCEGKYEALVHGAVTQPLMFAQLRCCCPKAAGSQGVSRPAPCCIQWFEPAALVCATPTFCKNALGWGDLLETWVRGFCGCVQVVSSEGILAAALL